MALGFGYNKAKVLSAAEKYVQQGKLQNAIAEYEKVSKVDPKDLTVLNTIGDLYARLGNGEAAAVYFKKVGERYASDGFAVKAIAMYKKLTKLTPSATDAIVRLAELYTQQGLYNDARAQYMSVADSYLKKNDNEAAAGILQKMLDLDPENAAMQKKVADLYIKLGRKQEAKDIYLNAAQSLHARGSMDAAREALDHVLKLDPKNDAALLLRGQIAAAGGDPANAVASLSKLPDIDSRKDAQQSILTAYLQAGDFDEAEKVATKMLTTSGDLSGISGYAEALMRAGNTERGLTVYERYSDKLLAENGQALIDSLTASISKVKDSAPALQSLLTLFRKAEAGNVIREVQELLAHACVQAGQLARSAELYKELAEAEPENPLHLQNYNQIVARMGTDPASRELTVEEGGQALMVDELENSAPAVMQEYTRDIADALNNALTDSELFASYNVPEKAIPPLEQVLPKAPNDVRLRQRLASLYARVNRFADAAQCCTVLADVHAVAGVADKAMQYREMAAKYTEQAAGGAPTRPSHQQEAVPVRDRIRPAAIEIPVDDVESEPIPFQASSVANIGVEEAAPAVPQEPTIAEFDLLSSPVQAVADAYSESPVTETASSPPPVEAANDWEEMLSVEAPMDAAQPVVAEQDSSAEVAAEAAVAEINSDETPDEIAEEARFYITAGMNIEADTAILRLEVLAPNHRLLPELKAAAAQAQAAVAETLEITPTELEIAPQSAKTEELEIAAASVTPVETEIAKPKPIAATPPPARKKPTPPAHAPSEESDFVLDLDTAPKPAVAPSPKITPKPTPVVPPAVVVPPAKPAAASAAASLSAHSSASADPLAGLVMDIDEALGSLNLPSGAPISAASASKMAANASSKAPVSAQISPQNAPPVPSETLQNQSFEAHSMLSDLLEEFKEEIEEPTDDGEDPETHYNLGVAFREMGLLDEAIGELQKVCRAIEAGKSFSQSMQTYTWLAQCLVDKGAPQAAIRWYEKALHVNGINEDSRLAVHYEMATAFEAAGDRKAALENFMQVYGSNIDYRDVADRIRGLRQ